MSLSTLLPHTVNWYDKNPNRPVLHMPLESHSAHDQQIFRTRIIEALRERFEGSNVGFSLEENDLHLLKVNDNGSAAFWAVTKIQFAMISEILDAVLGFSEKPQPFQEFPLQSEFSEGDADAYLHMTDRYPHDDANVLVRGWRWLTKKTSPQLGAARENAKKSLTTLSSAAQGAHEFTEFLKINESLQGASKVTEWKE